VEDDKIHSTKQQFPLQSHNTTKITNTTKTRPTQDNETNKNKTKKWAFFPYHSPRIRKLTTLFKHTDVGMAFRSTDTIQQLTKPKAQNHTQEHNRSGIYALSCHTCKLEYIGQTSRNLKQRDQEHTRYIRINDPQSAYAQHILKNQPEYGPVIDTMTLLKSEHKTPMLFPYEQLYLQTNHQNGHLIPEQNTGEPNPLLQLIIDRQPLTTVKTK
jgi:hypothetical protein